jgi:SAM-dependent MidA family methyltransferase
LPLHQLLVDRIRRDGPLTVAAFMELALYHPEHGYYASRAQRSGRRGDFYTSVDAGPFFGEMLAVQIGKMMRQLSHGEERTVDLVEAGAGNGRLMRDVLDALAADSPDEYKRVRVHLVERSARARSDHRHVLGPHAGRLVASTEALPGHFHGVLFANELLDAFPVHVLTRRGAELREIFVAEDGGRLIEREDAISSDAVRASVEMSGARIPPGARVEVSPAAAAWIREVGSRLDRGFAILIDYGDDAIALRSAARPDGTLRAFREHRVSSNWLDEPGEQDLTAHVDFTAVERAAKDAGLRLMSRMEQAKYLLALGAIERLERRTATLPPNEALRWRLAAKTLLVPGTVGWTHSVLIFERMQSDPFPDHGDQTGA